MHDSDGDTFSIGGASRGFDTTQWDIVFAAGHPHSADATQAREELCRRYWPPLYDFIRRNGYGVEQSRDLTQSFFMKLLEKEFWRRGDPEKGRFRSFLLKALKEFLLDKRDWENTAKRGGGVAMLSLEESVVEERYLAEACTDMHIERIFDRRWGFAVLAAAREKLRRECSLCGKTDLFECITQLSEERNVNVSYADVAARVGMSVAAFKPAVCRMRRRYGELVREEIAQTVSDPAEIRAEIVYLLEVIGS